MLKSSKLSHKSHKTSKDSAMRKSHLSKKAMRSRSPMVLSGSSRSSSMKHIPPGLKRSHPLSKSKASHSSRLHSIGSPHRSLSHRSKQESPVSMERARSMKSPKYDKRKHLSNSPVRHLKPNFAQGSIIPLDARDFSPYPAVRYQSAEALSPQYVSPPRKKVQRETDRYFSSRSMSASPPHRHSSAPMHPESHATHRTGNISPVLHHKHRRTVPSGHGEREKHSYDARHKHHMSPPIIQSGTSKEASMKVPYSTESSSDHYRSSSRGGRYPTGGQKTYGPTLHERFSTVIETHRHEPRIQYSREDLEKITIDIRNLREPSPTLRHIVNPSDVKLVRRANEGHRPIFDREEIKQAPRDMREDAYYERKKTSSTYNSAHGIDLREVENYQITRHRLDTHRDLFSSGSGRTLNDRWQNPEARKEGMSLDRDEREKNYERPPPTRNYAEARSRSHSGDRDFRSERYLDAKPVHSRSEYPRPPPDIAEPRSSIPYAHRKSNVPVDARHKLSVRKSDRGNHSSSVRPDPKGSFHPHSDRHYPEVMPSSRVERRDHHSPIPEPTKWSYKSRSPSREKMEYSRRPERIGYKSWSDKPGVISNRSSYTEHESRDGPSSYHARGGSRPFRSSTGFRGFRGPSRGSSFRGSFRGFRGPMNLRGRGTFRR